jgi:hypothetical protein
MHTTHTQRGNKVTEQKAEEGNKELKRMEREEKEESLSAA